MEWLRSKAKMITIYAAMLSAVLGSAVAWNKLDLPWFATHNDVQQVQQYAAGTREIVLNQEWYRLKMQLRELEQLYRQHPGDPDIIEDLTRAEQALRAVEKELRELAE